MRQRFRHFFTSSSLQHQLARQLLFGLLAMLLFLMSLIHFSVSQLTHAFVQSRLEHDIDSLVVALDVDVSGQWQIDDARLSEVYQRPYSGHYFLVQADSFSLHSRSLWDITLPELSNNLDPGNPTVGHLDGPKDQEWLTVTTRISKNKQPITIWIAEDIRPLQQLQLRFEFGILLVFVVVIPLLLWLQRKIIARNFQVFTGIQRSLEAVHQGHALQFSKQVPTEVADLVSEIERALTRASEQLKRSRTSVGNLAHELKRPLQNLRWYAEQSSPVNPSELMALYEQLQNLVTRELRRAAISGAPIPGKRFNPSDDISALASVLQRQYSTPISLQTILPNETLPFDRDDMLELIGNLLDNAWRFATREVLLAIEVVESAWIIRIEDDGPGMSAAQAQTLIARGVTRDEADQDHQGLGLHICQAVIESYGGHWQLKRSNKGGLKVEISLPKQVVNG